MECTNCGRRLSASSRRCITCGKEVPPSQHLLEESGVVEALPAEAAPAVVARPSCRAASLGDRLIAAALDSIIVFAVCAVLSLWSLTRWGVAGPGEVRITAASLLMACLLSGGSAFLYLWLMEAGFETTLGKAIIGLRVVPTKERSRLSACAIRNALRLVDGIGFYLIGALVAGCSRLRQRLGDIVGGTVVVEETLPFGIKALAVVVWGAALIGAIWALPRMALRPLPAHAPSHLGRTLVEVGRGADSAYIRSSRWKLELQAAPQQAQGAAVSAASLH